MGKKPAIYAIVQYKKYERSAAAGIDLTLLHQSGLRRLVGSVALIILMVAALIPTINSAVEAKPRLNEEQLAAVTWLQDNTEENAYILATASDAPWVLGWSGRRVIAPGLFEWNTYGKEDWEIFFETDDPEVAGNFLDVYDDPVYIFYSINEDNYLGLGKFRGENFRIVYNNGAVVYRYRGGN